MESRSTTCSTDIASLNPIDESKTTTAPLGSTAAPGAQKAATREGEAHVGAEDVAIMEVLAHSVQHCLAPHRRSPSFSAAKHNAGLRAPHLQGPLVLRRLAAGLVLVVAVGIGPDFGHFGGGFLMPVPASFVTPVQLWVRAAA